jgi:hypothetical protein
VVVVGPSYIGGSPLSVLLEAAHEADSVMVEKAVTVISRVVIEVVAGAVVITMLLVSAVSDLCEGVNKISPVEKLSLVVVSVAVAVVVSVAVPVETPVVVSVAVAVVVSVSVPVE